MIFSASPVEFMQGASNGTDRNVARAFAAKGNEFGLAARILEEEDSTSNQLHIRSDFTDPESMADIFAKVRMHLGAPCVVTYNIPHVHMSSSTTVSRPMNCNSPVVWDR